MSPNPRPGNYVAKVRRLVREATLTSGVVHNVEIAHDPWCGVFKGRRCDCDPAVRLVLYPDPERN